MVDLRSAQDFSNEPRTNFWLTDFARISSRQDPATPKTEVLPRQQFCFTLFSADRSFSQGAPLSQEEPRPDPPGRLRSAWSVLRGQRVTPLQMQVEWIEYKLIFNDILTRFGAQLARDVQAEKRRVKKELSQSQPAPTAVPSSKAAVRSRVASMVLGGRLSRGVAEPANGIEPQESDE